jgi:hypothetical protein
MLWIITQLPPFCSPILSKCQVFRAIAESMQGSFFLRKQPT